MIEHTIEKLEPIVAELTKTQSIATKYKIICEHVTKKEELFFDSVEKKFIYKSLQLIEQDDHLLHGVRQSSPEKVDHLFEQLAEIEKFYAPIGGIVGYHLTFLKLIAQKKDLRQSHEYEKPEGINLTEETREVTRAVRGGIELLKEIGEIYPVAGAGDRLNLKDEDTDEPLPAAMLNFLGVSLLKGLIRDLQAREFLHYKLTGKQARTPIILMTSNEKNNDEHIKQILKDNGWFNRSQELFFHILQPLVPVIAEDGLWAIKTPLEVILKPGGHGVIWLLAENQGALDWLLEHKRKKALVRQINNPIAGIDNGLLALTGMGCLMNKDFGFATCSRLVGATEGVDILIETSKQKDWEYKITNIEYTEFERHGIKDTPSMDNSKFSLLPANTNILFVDIPVLKSLLKTHPLPGLLVNLKTESECLDRSLHPRKVSAGRVESTMQNIADYIVTKADHKLTQKEKKNNLRTFVTFNHREKTISTTKKLANGDKILETPDGAFYDLQCNHFKLFTECGFDLAEITHEKAFIKHPPFILSYHPGLGPLYSVIKQKLRKGKLSKGSELRLEIAELYINNLSLHGSLVIAAIEPLGHLNQNEEIQYSEHMGKCRLENVHVENAGIDFEAENHFWKADIIRKEGMCIHLEGNAEFYAKDVHFKGACHICVPDGHLMKAEMHNKKVLFTLSKIDKPSWSWTYSFNQDDNIQLTLKN